MTGSEDAAMDGTKLMSRDPAIDHARMDTGTYELAAAHDPMLSVREAGNRLVRVHFAPHMGAK